MHIPTLEDLMGVILFVIGVALLLIGISAELGMTAIITGWKIPGFIVLGFFLCVTGYIMARSATGGFFGRSGD